MRLVYLAAVLGVALACTGDPFVAVASGGTDASLGNASGGGHGSQPTAPLGSGAAGAKAAHDGGSGGSEPGELEPEMADAAAGAGGAGGDAGAPAPPECPSAAKGSWEVGYFPELREASTHESHPFFQVTNQGEITTLDRIAVRYYFTKESGLTESGVCYWVTGDRCSLAKIEFGDVAMPTPNASRYLQVSFPGAAGVTVATGSLEVRVGFKTGSEALIQTNDYSFDPSPAAPSSAAPYPYKRWPQATLYVDGARVWGAEPCAGRPRSP